MKFIVIVLSLCLTSCAGKGMEFKLDVDSTDCGTKVVEFSTDYQVKALRIERTIEGGGTEGDGGSEGCGGGYTISMDEATTKDAQMGFMTEVMKMLMTLIPGSTLPTTVGEDP